ncbi:MAG TPA: amidohydrolase [Paenalcaligenes sp.]|nr:amidohydrolase [Paenalcaligenes sp.]
MTTTQNEPITIFSAKKIITMNDAQPEATHVAVQGGRILAVGNEEEVRSWCKDEVAIDDRYADQILMPGLIEGHSHLHEGVVWRYVYLGYYDRRGPDGTLWEGLKSIEEVIERLKEANTQSTDQEVLVGWGFDPIYFGERRMTVKDLDQVSTTRPVVIMHASMHLMNVNTPMLQKAGIDRFTDTDGVLKFEDGEPTGELQEFAAMFPVTKYIGNPFRTLSMAPESLQNFANICRIAGVTTATDLVNEFSEEGIRSLSSVTRDDDFPVRIVPAASGMLFGNDVEACLEALQNYADLGHDKLHLGLVKLIVDGSIQGFTARVRWPGYYNGAPNGIWIVAPEDLNDIIMRYHKAGIQLHIHTNGDEATEAAIDALEAAITAHPRPDHRHTLQHCQMADTAQYRRMAKLGLCVNLFSNHIFYWGDAHYTMTMGPERANRMNSCRTALDHGVPLAMHSDAPITPLGPLFTAWCAVNRITASGRQLGEHERITVPEALYAITQGAAYTLSLDHVVGSIEVGKYADFCVLAEDPLAVPAEELKDVKIVDTVIGGRSTQQ